MITAHDEIDREIEDEKDDRRRCLNISRERFIYHVMYILNQQNDQYVLHNIDIKGLKCNLHFSQKVNFRCAWWCLCCLPYASLNYALHVTYVDSPQVTDIVTYLQNCNDLLLVLHELEKYEPQDGVLVNNFDKKIYDQYAFCQSRAI